MRRQSDEHAAIADPLEKVRKCREFVLSKKTFGQLPVRGDADRFMFGSVVNALGEAIPVGFAKAEPVKGAAFLAKSIQVAERPFGVAVLPGIDAHFLTTSEKSHDPIRRVPVGE